MIPKKIIYCWFGWNQKNKLIEKSLQSWSILDDYKIIEFNESNSPMDHPFVKEMYKRKKWAFLSDYVRLWALYEYGGVYLDTDMEVIKPFDDLLELDCFMWFEHPEYVNGAIIGATKWNKFIKQLLDYYNSITDLPNYTVENIPRIITPLLEKKWLEEHKTQTIDGVTLFTRDYFYPSYPWSKTNITLNTYCIHHWNNIFWNEQKFSIIIPHLNEGYYLDIMLDSFHNYIDYENYEIIIVDDGSKHLQHLDFISNHFLKDKISVYKERGLWVAWARNFGASKATWDILVFLDSHMYIKTNILSEMNSLFINNKDISLLQPTIWGIGDKNMQWKVYSIADLCLKSTWKSPEWDIGEIIETPNIAWWATIVRRTVYNELGWFNKHFIKWWVEDLEFSMRAWLLGYKSYYTNTFSIAHYFKTSFENTKVLPENVLHNKILFTLCCFQNSQRQTLVLDRLQEKYWKKMYTQWYNVLVNSKEIMLWVEKQQNKFHYNDDWYFNKFDRYYKDFTETKK